MVKDLSEDKKTEIFVDLYIAALRDLCNNKFIQPPKHGSERWQQLEAARKLVDEMQGEYGDFIRCQFNALSRIKVVPQPYHLSSTRAVERYLIYQKMKNKYYKQGYCIEGDKMIVYTTRREYPISQVNLPSVDDPDATYAFYIANNDTKLKDEDKQHAIETLEYTIAKLRYKNKVPTEPLLRKLKELRVG